MVMRIITFGNYYYSMNKLKSVKCMHAMNFGKMHIIHSGASLLQTPLIWDHIKCLD